MINIFSYFLPKKIYLLFDEYQPGEQCLIKDTRVNLTILKEKYFKKLSILFDKWGSYLSILKLIGQRWGRKSKGGNLGNTKALK